VKFEWDARKNLRNIEKHGLAFEDAIEVFEDRRQLSEPARSVAGEVRVQTIGSVPFGIVFVVHTVRIVDGVEVTRIISARQASRQERKRYERSG